MWKEIPLTDDPMIENGMYLTSAPSGVSVGGVQVTGVPWLNLMVVVAETEDAGDFGEPGAHVGNGVGAAGVPCVLAEHGPRAICRPFAIGLNGIDFFVI